MDSKTSINIPCWDKHDSMTKSTKVQARIWATSRGVYSCNYSVVTSRCAASVCLGLDTLLEASTIKLLYGLPDAVYAQHGWDM